MTWMLNRELEGLGVTAHDLTYEAMATEKFDLIHLHFFEGHMGFKNPVRVWRQMSGLLRGIDRQKRLGAKLVYTAHNVVTHDAPWRWLEDWFLHRFMKRVDGTIFVSEASVPLVRGRFPELSGPSTVIPLSDYGDWYPDTVSREEARAQFGIPDDALVLVHVGLIRKYKNVPELIRTFGSIPGDVFLLIGGRVPDEALRQEIESLAKADSRVRLELRHLEDEDMQNFMRAADVAVFPYRNILNSGSAMMSLTFGIPVVVPNVGSMPELQKRVDSNWVRLYEGEFGDVALREAIDWAKGTERGETPPMEDLSVRAVAAQHAEFYQKVLNSTA